MWLEQELSRTAAAPAADPRRGYPIGRRGRNWTVWDPAGQLVCITVYRKCAVEVVRRLAA